MKKLKYNLATEVNTGTDNMTILSRVEMPWNEANEAIAKAEAYNGEYTIEDDGQPDPVPTPSDDSAVWDELDAAYQEGVDSV